MLNMIKMETYRMLHTRSAYVILIVLTGCVLFTNIMSRDEYRADTRKAAEASVDMVQVSPSSPDESGEETPNLGMTVTLPTTPGEQVTVFDLFAANIQGRFIALFIAIFTILFSGADMSSGYVKNTAGQVRSRAALVAAKAVAVMVYTVFTILFFVAIEAISDALLFGALAWGDPGEFLPYLGAQTALHCAFMVVLCALTVIIRSSVLSMVLGVLLCQNLAIILYGGAETLLRRMGAGDVDIISHTITGKIAMLPLAPSASDVTGGMCRGQKKSTGGAFTEGERQDADYYPYNRYRDPGGSAVEIPAADEGHLPPDRVPAGARQQYAHHDPDPGRRGGRAGRRAQ